VFLRLLLLLLPISLALKYVFHAPEIWVFASGVLAIIPLAEYIRKATEQVAFVAGSAIGGLLNVTFGNAAELIIALFVLRSGAVEVVKAQITGSIIGNSLLGLGLAILAGSVGREKQVFKKERAGMLSSMLILCVIALLLPAMFDLTERFSLAPADLHLRNSHLSVGVSVVLIVIYIANLIYTLVTHRDIFSIHDDEEGEGKATWSLPVSLGVLIGGTALIALEAELVSDALEVTAHSLHLSTFFLGIIVLAVVGNAAEYISAVYFARRNNMALVMTITVGSTIQVALFTAPLLVLISHLMGHPMDLVFANPLEMAAIAAVAFVVNAIAQDGETTWFEGLLLIGVYILLAMAFFFVA
jgi:Ca2+:H+ antiporter